MVMFYDIITFIIGLMVILSIILGIKRKWKEAIIIFLLALFAVPLVNVLESTPTIKRELQKRKEEEKKQQVIEEKKQEKDQEEELKKQQADFRKWYKDNMVISRTMDKLWKNNWVTLFNKLSKGEENRYLAYGKMKDLKEALREIDIAYNQHGAPDSFYGEKKELIDKSNENMETAVSLRIEAIDSALKYLDEMKPSDFDLILDKLKQSDNHILASAVNIVELQKQLRIKINTN